MVKDFHYLTEDEYAQFVRLYIDYFRNHIVYYREGMPRFLNSLINKAWAPDYVRVMLDRIKMGERTCLVSYSLNGSPDETLVDGFIVGRCLEESNEGWISHFYVKSEDHMVRKERSMRLCREFAQVMKYFGARTLVAESQMDDPEFIDTLESLYFQEKKSAGDVVEYEKTI